MDKALIPFSKQALYIIAGYGFVLNTIWEFAQAGPLYDMWEEVSIASGLFHITMAIIGDVVIVLTIAILAAWICGLSDILDITWKASACMLITGFISGLFLEWFAKTMNWWTYNDLMPTISLFGETVGLSPLLQITLLPYLSVVLAVKVGNPLRVQSVHKL